MQFHDGKFKILLLADVQDTDTPRRPTKDLLCAALDQTKPDLAVLLGDNTGGNWPRVDVRRTQKAVDAVARELYNRGVPFALVFGNHDHEQGLSNAELLQIARQIPYCMASDVEGITGEGNYLLEIKGSQDDTPKAILYFIDSNQYSQLKEAGVNGYDYIHRDQIDWYVQSSSQYTAQNNNQPLPSLAFFHIPLPEYNQAARNENTTLYGIRREQACSPELNTGMFAAMKEQGDIMGVFVGHDHDNDYAVNWYNILLAYGRFTGGPTEYIHIPNGARIIELTEGQRTIDTWIRLTDGSIEQRTSFPKDYVK